VLDHAIIMAMDGTPNTNVASADDVILTNIEKMLVMSAPDNSLKSHRNDAPWTMIEAARGSHSNTADMSATNLGTDLLKIVETYCKLSPLSWTEVGLTSRYVMTRDATYQKLKELVSYLEIVIDTQQVADTEALRQHGRFTE
jgi:hypothetical protein